MYAVLAQLKILTKVRAELGFQLQASVSQSDHTKERWRLYILPQYLANLTQPKRHEES